MKIAEKRIKVSELKKTIREVKDVSAKLQGELEVDKYTSARAAFLSLLKEISHKLGLELRFDHPNLEETLREVKVDKVDPDPVIRDPDAIDTVYRDLIPKDYRKSHGQFLTPVPIAEFMVKWVLQGGCTSILDPGVGPGIFLSKVLESHQKEHITLHGIDTDALVLESCNIRLGLKMDQRAEIKLTEGDFLKMNPLEKYDIVICNPPYLNFHNFKEPKIIEKMEENYSFDISRLTNVYPLFLMHSYSFVKESGRVAFITPSEFFYTGYGERLKEFLLDKFTIDAFILTSLEKPVFGDVLTSAVITLLRKTDPVEDHEIKFIGTEKIDDILPSPMLDIVTGSGQSDLVMVNKIMQNSINGREKWLRYFKGSPEEKYLNKLIPLKELAKTKRGIATGANDFYTLSKEEIKKWKIKSRFLVPVLRKASDCKNYNFTRGDFRNLKMEGKKVYLLYCFKKPSKNLKKYLAYGKSQDIHERYLPSHRKPWYSMEKRDPAPILATTFSRGKMRFIFNKMRIRNLAAFHGIYPNFADELMIKALLAYLNSKLFEEISILQKRVYGGGLGKFEPNDLEKVRAIDVRTINMNIANRLASLFDELCDAARRSQTEEDKVKEEIDSYLKAILDQVEEKKDL